VPSNEHKPEEIIGKLREVEIVLSQGGTTAEARRWISVNEQTYYQKVPRLRSVPSPVFHNTNCTAIAIHLEAKTDSGIEAPNYSKRRACTGSSRAALRAGSQAATPVRRTKNAGAARNTLGSHMETP
jgi:hypothetical protein